MSITRNSIATLTALCVVAGCRNSTAIIDGANLPATGLYSYAATYTPSAGATPVRVSGTLRITAATSDRLTGTWQVPGYLPDVQYGRFDTDHYEVEAQIPNTGVFDHFVKLGANARALQCYYGQLRVITAPDGTYDLYPASCQLTYAGP